MDRPIGGAMEHNPSSPAMLFSKTQAYPVGSPIKVALYDHEDETLYYTKDYADYREEAEMLRSNAVAMHRQTVKVNYTALKILLAEKGF